MSNQPCPTALLCDCAVTPWRNFSAERPDNPDFFAFAFYEGDPPLNNPPVDFTNPIGVGGCFSVVSQVDANDCSLRVAEQAVWDPWRTPQGGHVSVFGNQETSCAFSCPDGAPDFIFTIAAGTVIALSQAEADEIADSLCFYRGNLVIDCTNPVKRSIEVLAIDQPLDMADNAKVVVGTDNAGLLSQIYSGGIVSSFSLAGSTSALFLAVSPSGLFATGDDSDAGFNNHVVSYDLSSYRNLGTYGGSTQGEVVNDSGLILTDADQIVNYKTGAVVFDLAPTFVFHVNIFQRRGMNGAAQVLAQSTVGPPIMYRWSPPGVAININPPNLLTNYAFGSTVSSINESGHVSALFNPTVGTAPHVFYFNGINSIDIGNFGADMGLRGMNNNDTIVGLANVGITYKAYQYRPSGGLSLLPEWAGIPANQLGIAEDVNDGGFIVGEMGGFAFLYNPIHGVTKKLTEFLPPASGWTTLDSAIFINNKNQIVGSGTYLGNPTNYILQLGDDDVK